MLEVCWVLYRESGLCIRVEHPTCMNMATAASPKKLHELECKGPCRESVGPGVYASRFQGWCPLAQCSIMPREGLHET